MLTKAIIVEVISKYSARVRIPTIHKLRDTTYCTADEDLPIATVCSMAGSSPALRVSDVVYVEFEDDLQQQPVIVGWLVKEDNVARSNVEAAAFSVNVKCELPAETTIGEASASDINNIRNSKGNLQTQIDLLENDIKGKISKYDLLWTNPTPTAAYAGQTISIPTIQNYNLFLMESYGDKSDSQMIPLVLGSYSVPASTFFISESNYRYHRAYKVDVLNNTLTIGDGYFNGTLNNEAIIPYRLYGMVIAGGGGSVEGGTMYPIGAVYFSVLNTNPSITLGYGTWELIGSKLAVSENVVGNGKGLGLTNGTGLGVLGANTNNLYGYSGIGKTVGSANGNGYGHNTMGVPTLSQLGDNPENSGLIVAATEIYSWKRTA